jgi:hypothetical protein
MSSERRKQIEITVKGKKKVKVISEDLYKRMTGKPPKKELPPTLVALAKNLETDPKLLAEVLTSFLHVEDLDELTTESAAEIERKLATADPHLILNPSYTIGFTTQKHAAKSDSISPNSRHIIDIAIQKIYPGKLTTEKLRKRYAVSDDIAVRIGENLYSPDSISWVLEIIKRACPKIDPFIEVYNRKDQPLEIRVGRKDRFIIAEFVPKPEDPVYPISLLQYLKHGEKGK